MRHNIQENIIGMKSKKKVRQIESGDSSPQHLIRNPLTPIKSIDAARSLSVPITPLVLDGIHSPPVTRESPDATTPHKLLEQILSPITSKEALETLEKGIEDEVEKQIAHSSGRPQRETLPAQEVPGIVTPLNLGQEILTQSDQKDSGRTSDTSGSSDITLSARSVNIVSPRPNPLTEEQFQQTRNLVDSDSSHDNEPVFKTAKAQRARLSVIPVAIAPSSATNPQTPQKAEQSPSMGSTQYLQSPVFSSRINGFIS